MLLSDLLSDSVTSKLSETNWPLSVWFQLSHTISRLTLIELFLQHPADHIFSSSSADQSKKISILLVLGFFVPPLPPPQHLKCSLSHLASYKYLQSHNHFDDPSSCLGQHMVKMAASGVQEFRVLCPLRASTPQGKWCCRVFNHICFLHPLSRLEKYFLESLVFLPGD